jgi:PAS domain S-box-containing protein
MNAPATETMFEEMKRYVRFTDQDSRRLAEFGPVAAPHFVRIAAEFYDRIREHDDAHKVFTGEAQIARLQRMLVHWMERLFAGPHDEAYFSERAKIGRVHVKIGLPQRYMFTAMTLIRQSLERIADTLPAPRSIEVREALGRMLDLELAVMLETYHEDFAARLERVERLEREQLERPVPRGERRYATAVELVNVLLIGLDATGSIVLFNREAERVSGYARDQALGRSFVDLLIPEPLRAEDGARLLRAVAGTVPLEQSWEAPLRTRAGCERTIRWQIAGVPLAPGEDIAVFAMGQDVTDANALLDRTMQSERLAAVGTLAAGLAHEIRNPLNGALLHVTFLERALKRAGGDAEALEAARFIASEIQRLSALVTDFLVFARPAPPQLEPASLHGICQRAADIVAADAGKVGATVATDFGPTELVLRLDPSKIEQVVLNLLRNAVDAVAGIAAGSVVLRVRRRPRHAVIEVEDNGPGLQSPEAPIFDAFYSTKPNGTGLGLAIVHRVVTDHGGTIDVDSRTARTVFRVTLPIVNDPDSMAL